MKKNPLATICIPAYNSERNIHKTIESILSQSYPDIKIIVSDNNSTDNTESIVKSFKDARLFYRKNVLSRDCLKTFRPLENCNSCFLSDLFSGEFVAFYHSDDIYEKNIVEKEIDFLTKNPQTGAVFTLGKKIDKNDKVIGKFKLPKELLGKNTYNFEDIFQTMLKRGNTFLPTPTFMTRPEVFKSIGMFGSDFGIACELGTWMKIAEKYPIGILNENLFRYRLGGGSLDYNSTRTKRSDYFDVMDYYLRKNNYSSSIKKDILSQYDFQKKVDDSLIAINLLVQDRKKEAKQLINSAFPFNALLPVLKNIDKRLAKGLCLIVGLFIADKIGLEEFAAKILHKVRYGI